MNCCSKCFTSPYLVSIIGKEDNIGECNFCGSLEVSLYSPRELLPFFKNIFHLYIPSKDSGKNLATALKSDLQGNLDVFSDIVGDNLMNLLKSIAVDDMDIMNTLLENNVTLEKKSLFADQSDQIHNVWNDFKEEIKFQNRYHIQNAIDLNILESFFRHENLFRKIKKGKIFYRCRISDRSGYAKNEMGHPPTPELATAGRANPKGISYLYLADSIETSLYETRASLYDYVTVAEFQVIEDLDILNLKNPKDDPVPWAEDEEIENFLIYIPFIQTLQKEISLPVKKRDKSLDYIPTQYISEFIKSLGFDGVQYKSSLYSSGYNLAIFNPEKFHCLKTRNYEIEGIELKHQQLSTAKNS